MRKAASVILIVLTLIIAAGCRQPASTVPGTIYLKFDVTETKYVEAKGINETAYDVTTEAVLDSVTAKASSMANLFWSYRAEKKDSLGKTGDTNNGWLPVLSGVTGRGLERDIEFSIGSWIFELKAYSSAADRETGKGAVYSGVTSMVSVSQPKTVVVPVAFVAENSIAKASFYIETSIEQDKLEGMKTYEITKIVAKARPSNNPEKIYTTTLKNNGKGLFTGIITKMPYCITTTFSYDIYVDNEPFPRGTSEEVSSDMSEIETEVRGTAKVYVKQGEGIDISLDAVIDGELDITQLPGYIPDGTEAEQENAEGSDISESPENP